METPSSTKRITRSQTRAAFNNNNNNNNIPISRKIEDSDKDVSRSRRRNAPQQQALMDITNDSPIIGLAMGRLQTPSSGVSKSRSNGAKHYNTPGSGEALLRCQVKTLLQQVEEEAELSKLSLGNRSFLLQGFVDSPTGLLAPTPANTPQLPNLSGDGGVNNSTGLVFVTPSVPVVEEQLEICQVVKQESPQSQKNLTRSLLLDFSEKSETSDSSECSSVLTSENKGKTSPSSPTTDDDGASNWSIQVNASTTHLGEDDEDQAIEEEDYFYNSENDDYEAEEEEVEDGDGDGGLSVDELCEAISKISVNQNTMPKFTGKHTRFEYDSDGELVGEIETDNSASASPSVLRLKGLPTPKGKHLRFQEEEVEEN